MKATIKTTHEATSSVCSDSWKDPECWGRLFLLLGPRLCKGWVSPYIQVLCLLTQSINPCSYRPEEVIAKINTYGGFFPSVFPCKGLLKSFCLQGQWRLMEEGEDCFIYFPYAKGNTLRTCTRGSFCRLSSWCSSGDFHISPPLHKLTLCSLLWWGILVIPPIPSKIGVLSWATETYLCLQSWEVFIFLWISHSRGFNLQSIQLHPSVSITFPEILERMRCSVSKLSCYRQTKECRWVEC